MKIATYTYAMITYEGNAEIQLTQQSQNVYFLGKPISAEGNLVSTDRLGSVRSGGPGGLGYQAQYPYGVEYSLTANDREKYATYTRDSATGFDYAVNRYYASQWGRFLSPDPYAGSSDPSNPQSWNLYPYVGGDPVNSSDPSGLFGLPPYGPGGPVWPGGGGEGFGTNPVGGSWGFGFGGGYGCYDPSLLGNPYGGDSGLPPWTFGLAQMWCGPGVLPFLGAGAGSGGGPDPQALLDARIDNLGNCTRILGGASASEFLKVADTITYFNGAPGAPGSGQTQNAVSGNGSSLTLAATVKYDVADTLNNAQGNPIPYVVLGRDFYNDPTVSQPNVLLHEALHVALSVGDPGLKTYLSQFGFVNGYGGAGGTDDITLWLKADCPSQKQ
jgi:RHS repeat-associated protein